jgi:hypothetical protein
MLLIYIHSFVDKCFNLPTQIILQKHEKQHLYLFSKSFSIDVHQLMEIIQYFESTYDHKLTFFFSSYNTKKTLTVEEDDTSGNYIEQQFSILNNNQLLIDDMQTILETHNNCRNDLGCSTNIRYCKLAFIILNIYM